VFAATARRATSTRNAGAVSRMSYGLPSAVAARAARRCAAVLPNVIIWARIASAFGCRPSANRAAICSSVTGSPACISDVGQSGPQPGAGGLTLLGVVVPETGVPAVGVVERSDLPGQVRVPVPGGQLVNRLHT